MCVFVCRWVVVFCCVVGKLGDLAATFNDSLAELTLRSCDYVMIWFPSFEKKIMQMKHWRESCWSRPPGAETYSASLNMWAQFHSPEGEGSPTLQSWRVCGGRSARRDESDFFNVEDKDGHQRLPQGPKIPSRIQMKVMRILQNVHIY